MAFWRNILTAVAIAGLAVNVGAAEPEGFMVCESQQELEQLLQSDGQIVPDGCRFATVATVRSTAGTLCSFDLEPEDEGVWQQLRDAAVTTRWWTECDNLGVGAPPQ
ncbi:hypothetical protein HUS23_03780 [Ectothiorhodospiraceae bacterium 2226]|nr:hypothetical protein HUS23_03780 [Ectothiorhodospiraceae bacterium 2226]